MREYTTDGGETLRQIAPRYYDLRDEDAKIDSARFGAVLDGLLAENCAILGTDQRLEPGLRIRLPRVDGVEPCNPVRDLGGRVALGKIRSWTEWHLTPVLLGTWLLGLVVVYTLAVFQPYWNPRLTVPQNEYLSILTGQLAEILALLERNRATALCLWSLALFLLWTYYKATPAKPPHYRARVRYLLLWAIGLALLLGAAAELLRAVVPGLAVALQGFIQPVPLLISWTFIVLVLYVQVGDRSDQHKDYTARYRSVWISLAAAIFITCLADFYAYNTIKRRVDGILAPSTLARTTVDSLQAHLQAADDDIKELERAMDDYEQSSAVFQLTQSGRIATPEPSSDADSAPQARRSPVPGSSDPQTLRDAFYQRAARVLLRASSNADSAKQMAEAAIWHVSLARDDAWNRERRRQEEQQDRTGPPDRQDQPSMREQLGLANQILGEAKVSTEQLVFDMGTIAEELEAFRWENRSIWDFRSSVAARLSLPLGQARATTDIARRAIESADVPVLPTFLWIGAFYSIFILLPWVLFLLFVFRKREDRTWQILHDLACLRIPLQLVFRSRLSAPGHTIDRMSDKDREVASEELRARTFSNFEYVLSLLLLSILTAIGWYYIFYPKNVSGLTDLVLRPESAVRALAEHLRASLFPLTLGFAGAYFYSMQMLVRRYFSADLYPAAFLQAATRLVVVFIFSLLLTAMGSLTGWSQEVSVIAAFVAGVFPMPFLRQILRMLNKVTRAAFPESIESAPLTELDGVNIWVESRLLEENVENIESMATCRIERLILNTYYPTSQIVDWIDQSILYLHAGHRAEWFPAFRAAGIRTASDLLDAVGIKVHCRAEQKCDTFRPDPRALTRTVAALNTARTSRAVVKTSGELPPMTAEILCGICESVWPDSNIEYVLRFHDNIETAATRPAA